MFNSEDFTVFDDPTLAGRLEKIKKIIDPKFELLGESLVNQYQNQFTQPLYVHIAKHIRRHKNPPTDTWMAISTNKRGYKALPHIEIGFWPECIFSNLSFLAELDDRKQVVERLLAAISYNQNFGISTDHTQSHLEPLTKENLQAATKRYLKVKNADLVIGFTYDKESFENEKLLNDLPKLFALFKSFAN